MRFRKLIRDHTVGENFVEAAAPRIAPELLQSRCKLSQHTADGGDGWHPGDLLRLGRGFFVELARLWNGLLAGKLAYTESLGVHPRGGAPQGRRRMAATFDSQCGVANRNVGDRLRTHDMA